ncbi:eukaryotic translation initiation factor 4E transporter isoform X2 [Oncorhynchus mykiss]|uniref:eukaryotic translation initiation factor 4E transporter isoform X2 n=1 Tax=Oncorhynchus mykiss TaxID=8022 RepID=UPI0018782BB4|nr:eukaryotic translation initiation factor 4E transporter isoform X2 [Oncorhynchus mykiss]
MERDACVEVQENGDIEVVKESTGPSPYRYTKEELLEIKYFPICNERPDCLLEKFDSDGVWDPEKWHASLYSTSECSSPVDGYKKDFVDDRIPLKRRIADPRERLKEDDLDVVLSPQRRSFGGGCVGNALPAPSRRPVSPLENKENESLRLGVARRIGSGRIMAARGFEREREPRVEKERDFKDKRFRRDFGDKRVFSERRRNDLEEEPEWFSGGPTSQSETIELIGFDDKILEEDKRRPKRSRKRTDSVREVECNGGLAEEHVVRDSHSTADQEVPHPEVLPEQTSGDFDFNEFFNLEKTMPGLASMIEDVLGEGPVSASRFSRWFSSNLSPSGSRSSSLRSTPHEELERLAGLDPRCTSPSQGGPVPYFTPIQSVECRDKVDILELLHKAKIDLKPLLSSLNVNKQRLQQSTHSGVVLSLEEVEGGLKELKVGSELHHQMPRKAHQHQQQGSIGGGGSTSSGTPFMAEHLERALTGGVGPSAGPPCSRARDPDMSAFNKLVSSMKASGTLPSHPKENQVNSNLNQPSNPAVVPLPEATVPAQQHKNIFQELLGAQGPPCRGSPSLLHSLLGSPNPPPHPGPGPQHSLLQHRGPSPPLFTQRAPSPDYFHGRMHPPAGYPVGPQPMIGEQFPEIHRSFSPGPGHGPTLQQQQQMRALSMAVDQADRQALIIQQDLALHAHHAFQTGYNKPPPSKAYQHNRQTRMNRSPGPGPHPAGRNSPGNTVTSMLSPSFVPTSVIRKMYETKEKSRDEPGSRPDSKEGHSQGHSQEDSSSPSSFLDGMNGSGSQSGGVKTCSTPLSSHSQARQHPQEHPRPGSAGHHTPTLVSPRSVSPFPRPIYPVPLLSHGHVPMVRPALPQLHPSVLQRMLAQGIQPQQIGPALIQAGIFPQHVDLSQLQGLPSTLLGQPLYPLGATGHPLLLPRASNPMQLALMQQQLQQQQQRPMHPTVPGHQTQNHGPHRTNHSQQRVGSPPGVGGAGLAKWFGSDVLQQPLPSMPAKVISVDELEFGPSGVSYNQNSG